MILHSVKPNHESTTLMSAAEDVPKPDDSSSTDSSPTGDSPMSDSPADSQASPLERDDGDGALVRHLIDRVEQVMLEAEQKTKPVELSPYREQLFELFVTAEGAGYLDEEQEETEYDLSADGVCRVLAQRWGLKDAAMQSAQSSDEEQQIRLSETHVAKMRLLWSVMRMWMEWSYAWKRWSEFHDHDRR